MGITWLSETVDRHTNRRSVKCGRSFLTHQCQVVGLHRAQHVIPLISYDERPWSFNLDNPEVAACCCPASCTCSLGTYAYSACNPGLHDKQIIELCECRLTWPVSVLDNIPRLRPSGPAKNLTLELLPLHSSSPTNATVPASARLLASACI